MSDGLLASQVKLISLEQLKSADYKQKGGRSLPYRAKEGGFSGKQSEKKRRLAPSEGALFGGRVSTGSHRQREGGDTCTADKGEVTLSDQTESSRVRLIE